MTQEMCEDIDFLAERKGVEDEVVVESVLYNDEGVLRGNAAAAEGKEEWNSSPSEDNDGSIEDEDELESDNDPWEAIQGSQLEISQQSQPSSLCAVPPPPCEREEENTSGREIQAENGRNRVEYFGAIVDNNNNLRNTTSEAMKKGRGDSERESSSPVVTLESFLDEEAEKKRTGGQGESNAAQTLPSDMVEEISSNPPRIEENNGWKQMGNGRSGKKPKPANVTIVERYFVEGTKEEQEYEMNDDDESFFHDDDPMEISVPPLGKETEAATKDDDELGLLHPANDEVAQGVKQIENKEVYIYFITELLACVRLSS